MDSKAFANAVCAQIDAGAVSSPKDLQSLKARLSAQFGLTGAPSNPDILMWASAPSRTARLLLSIKAVRTLSGVAPVAVMTKPIDCAHGTCIYCPGGEQSVFGAIPKSYTGNEPASMRAVSNRFDGFLQVFNRLYQLVATGHSVQKIELILMGGTFPSFARAYQDEFVRDAFWAANTFSDWFFPKGLLEEKKFSDFFASTEYAQSGPLHEKLLSFKAAHPTTLVAEQEKNESSFCRLVALCIETKPDYSMESHIDAMLLQGCTRVELGIQCLDAEILKFTNRGHTLADSISATALLKDSCLKVTYHM
ncbi:MAG: radical SAM protein, partial [Candidatus Diapherotrites archaeon]|nr:radical SAM protein [Candidatus Diapherotrites archaeon]